jgi:hypothetical protein
MASFKVPIITALVVNAARELFLVVSLREEEIRTLNPFTNFKSCGCNFSAVLPHLEQVPSL